MQIEEASAFESVGYERYVGWVVGSEGVEMEDGEEEVLVGVCSVGFRRHAFVILGREMVCEVLRSDVIRNV